MFGLTKRMTMPSDREALPGRSEPIMVNEPHAVLGSSLKEPFPKEMQKALFGMGCFWGAERLFWEQEGVYTTAVGYGAGLTPNPSYEEVCSGFTGHNELVLVVFDPKLISYEVLLALFWENHNPTQGMQQANDRGTQYRSGIYTYDDVQTQLAKDSLAVYQKRLTEQQKSEITTEIEAVKNFYYAELYHQQYLAKNPNGYCNMQTLAKTGLPEYN